MRTHRRLNPFTPRSPMMSTEEFTPAHEPRHPDDRNFQASRIACVATQTPKVIRTCRSTRSPASPIRSAS